MYGGVLAHPIATATFRISAACGDSGEAIIKHTLRLLDELLVDADVVAFAECYENEIVRTEYGLVFLELMVEANA